MTTIAVNDLDTIALNWAIARERGYTDLEIWHTGAVTSRQPNGTMQRANFVSNWNAAGMLIDEANILFMKDEASGEIVAYTGEPPIGRFGPLMGRTDPVGRAHDHRAAAARCYLAIKCGPSVDIPQEVLQQIADVRQQMLDASQGNWQEGQEARPRRG